MLNVLKLKAARVQANVSIQDIAQEIGRNPATIYKKFNGKQEFTLSELNVLRKMLHIDIDSFCNIFFDNELVKTQEIKPKEEN